jgi:nitroimidazol reductase NimA-like FMN-containing flavoprotein (pyridoxamine 5'-phosphate oxidase superfamily)
MAAGMTREEREAFLLDVHVGILSIPDGHNGPFAVPIWYQYEPDADCIWMTTGRLSRKGQLLEKAQRISLCAHSEVPPYKYVSVEGPIVSIEPASTDKDTLRLAHRYLGVAAGNKYVASMRTRMEEADPVLVRMRPERWRTFDPSKAR